MKGKLIVIEGTDCSGKETQSKMLQEKLLRDGVKLFKMQFPNYESATGKIIGGPYLGKDYIGPTYFEEGAANVPAKVASLYYAADRLYNIDIINEHLQNGEIVILDRYVESNMGHQGGKLETKEKRNEMFEFLERLEFEMLGLPRPDAVIFLHMPYEQACILKKDREEKPDGHEASESHLRRAEQAYLEMAEKYGFKTVKCVNEDTTIKSIEEINEDVYKIALEVINS